MHEWNLSMRSWASEGQKTSNHLPYDRRIKATRILTRIKKWLTTSLKWVRTLSTKRKVSTHYGQRKDERSRSECNSQCAMWVHTMDKGKKCAQEENDILPIEECTAQAQKNKEVSLRNASLLSLLNEWWEASGRPSLQVLHDKRPWLNLSPFCFALVAASRAFLISIVSLPLRDVQRVNAPTRRSFAAHCLIERAWFNSTCILFCFGCNVSTHRSSAALTRSH